MAQTIPPTTILQKDIHMQMVQRTGAKMMLKDGESLGTGKSRDSPDGMMQQIPEQWVQ